MQTPNANASNLLSLQRQRKAAIENDIQIKDHCEQRKAAIENDIQIKDHCGHV